MSLTDHQLEEFIFVKEGGNRSPAYDDFQPWLELKPGDEVKGTLTVGPGFIKREDGTPVQIGDTMSDQQAYERLRKYIAEEIEPVLEDLIHVPIATSMANALGSLIYNFGATEVYGWRLWGRINAGEPPINIINEWIDGTFSSKGVPMLGLWRRRFSELAMAFQVDWRAGDNVDWEHKPEEFLEVLGWDGTMPKPEPIVDPELFKELEIPARGKDVEPITDPTPETPLTTSDLNEMQLEQRKNPERPIVYADFDTARTIVDERSAIKAPNVSIENEPGAMEDSETSRGISKETSGRDDVRLATVMSGAATAAATASTASENLSEVMKNTNTIVAGVSVMQLIWLMLVFGLPLLGYGLWKMHRGKQIKNDGRAQAVRLKV